MDNPVESELKSARQLLHEAVQRLDQMSAQRSRSGTRGTTIGTGQGASSHSGTSQSSSGPGPSSERNAIFRPLLSQSFQSVSRGKRPAAAPTFKSKKKKLKMWQREFICLATPGQTNLPTPLEKAELIRAGLGTRTLCVEEYSDSGEFHDEIIGAFPKLKEGGGYELLRSATNKKLDVIPPDVGGYNVPYVKSVVGQAKVYIRPIQKPLSLDPLLEGQDLSAAPKVSCLGCGLELPMHQLRDHLSECQSESQEKSRQSESSPSGGSINTPPYSPTDLTHDHGSQSTESSVVDLTETTETEDEMIQKAIEASLFDESDLKSTKDCITALQNQFSLKPVESDEEWVDLPRTVIDVRRSFVVADALREARKVRFEPEYFLQVYFVGEPAVDTGGPSREFWRLFLMGVVEHYCLGNERKKMFLPNVSGLQDQSFHHIGVYVSMSILQGGPGFPVLHPAVYHYLVSGEYLGIVKSDDDVPNASIRMLLSEIERASSDQELQAIFENEQNFVAVTETGFRKALCRLSLRDRSSLVQALRDYYTIITAKAETDQFSDGLCTLGVLGMMKKYPLLMQPLFVATEKTEITKGYFKSLLKAQFSPTGTPCREAEEAAYIHLLEFIEECEDGKVVSEDGQSVTPADLLIFFTGADSEPPLGFLGEPKLTFSAADALATASTCDMCLCIPTKYEEYAEFQEMMTLSILGHGGFGNP